MQLEVMVEITYAKDTSMCNIQLFFPLYSLATGHFQCSMEEEERKITLTTQFRPRTWPQDYIDNKAVPACFFLLCACSIGWKEMAHLFLWYVFAFLFSFLLMRCLHCRFFLLCLENGSSGRIPSNFDGGLRMVLWEFSVVFGAFNQESSPKLHRHQKTKKKQHLVRKHGHRCGIFGFLLVPVQVWWWLHFFLVPASVLWSQARQTCTGTKKKNKRTKPLDAPNLHRHQKN